MAAASQTTILGRNLPLPPSCDSGGGGAGRHRRCFNPMPTASWVCQKTGMWVTLQFTLEEEPYFRWFSVFWSFCQEYS